MAKLSVVTPCFNCSETINETIHSLLNQSFDDWDMICVDDGSTDDTIKLIQDAMQNDDRIQLIKRETEKSGGSICRNIGWKNAKSNYVIFLDSDDLLQKDALKFRYEIMTNHPSLEFAVFNMDIFESQPGDLSRRLNRTSSKYSDLELFMRFLFPWQTTCPVWTIPALKKLNGFDEKYSRFQDVEFHIRALSAGLNYHYFKDADADCYYRLPSTGSLKPSSQKIKKLRENFIHLIEDFEELFASNRKHFLFSLSGIIRNYLIPEGEYASCYELIEKASAHHLLAGSNKARLKRIVNWSQKGWLNKWAIKLMSYPLGR